MSGHAVPSDLAERVARCMPAATYELETLVAIAGVHASTGVATAQVSCGPRPRMTVNPEFVARWCRRDEHLFLLVMHELWHVILAHTALYPRASRAHEIAFDAVINAGLARLHPEPEYRGFLEAINDGTTVPGAFLRPPPGWPLRPHVPRSVSGTARRLVEQLYDPGRPIPTYAELVDVIAGAPGDGVALLGDHDPPVPGAPGPLDDAVFGDVVRRIVASWPPPPVPLGGRDLGGLLGPWHAAVGVSPPPEARAAFDAVLRRVLGPPSGPESRARRRARVQGGAGVLLDPRDRLAPARAALGVPGLWSQPYDVTVRSERREPAAHVYLDVSGSMFDVIAPLLGMLAPYVRSGRARLWQFSTDVAPLTPADLSAGELTTTAGTDVDCVLAHVLGADAVRHALVLTDGYTGRGSFHLRDGVRRAGTAIHVVLPGESAWTDDLADLAASITVLPPLSGRFARA